MLLLDEIEDEARWDAAFGGSQDFLGQLASEAMDEHEAGRTRDPDPNALGGEG